MIYREYQPQNPILKKYIEYYNTITGNGQTPHTFTSIPEGKCGLVFMLRGSASYIQSSCIEKFNQSVFWGLLDAPVLVQMSPNIQTFSVVFRPGMAGCFVPRSMEDKTGRPIPLNFIYNKNTNFITEQLAEEKNSYKKIQLLESFLLNQLNINNNRILKSLELISGSLQFQSLTNISEQLNISSRRFRMEFRAHCGISPKRLMRILRFRKALYSVPNFRQNLTAFALNLGYYDQAHFCREFKILSGCSPKEYFYNEKKNEEFVKYKRFWEEGSA